MELWDTMDFKRLTKMEAMNLLLAGEIVLVRTGEGEWSRMEMDPSEVPHLWEQARNNLESHRN